MSTDDGSEASTDGVLMSGMLFKKGQRRHNWKERFFELTKQKLAYYTTSDKRQLKGELLLQNRDGKPEDVNVQITPHGSRKTGKSGASEWRFVVSAGGMSIMIAAPTEEDMNEWVLSLQRAVSNPKRYSLTNMSESDLTETMVLGSDDDEDGDNKESDPFMRTTSLSGDTQVGGIHLSGKQDWHHGSVRKAGVLWKRGQVNKDWRTRYFELRPGQLRYYKSEEQARKAAEEERQQEGEQDNVVASLTAAKGCLMFGSGEEVEDEDLLTVNILPKAYDKSTALGAGLRKLKLSKSSHSSNSDKDKQEWQFMLRTGGFVGDSSLSGSSSGSSGSGSGSGRELVLAAASESEMMDWVEALKEFAVGESSDHVHLNQIAAKLVLGLDIRDRLDLRKKDGSTGRPRKEKKCFSGTEAVNFMMDEGLAKDVKEAVALGNRLISAQLLRHVSGLHSFQNDGGLLYRFTMQAQQGTSIRHMLRKGFKGRQLEGGVLEISTAAGVLRVAADTEHGMGVGNTRSESALSAASVASDGGSSHGGGVFGALGSSIKSVTDVIGDGMKDAINTIGIATPMEEKTGKSMPGSLSYEASRILGEYGSQESGESGPGAESAPARKGSGWMGRKASRGKAVGGSSSGGSGGSGGGGGGGGNTEWPLREDQWFHALTASGAKLKGTKGTSILHRHDYDQVQPFLPNERTEQGLYGQVVLYVTGHKVVCRGRGGGASSSYS